MSISISIFGRDELEAERKLRQIYQGCEILEAHRRQTALNGRGPVSYEDVMDLLTASRTRGGGWERRSNAFASHGPQAPLKEALDARGPTVGRSDKVAAQRKPRVFNSCQSAE